MTDKKLHLHDSVMLQYLANNKLKNDDNNIQIYLYVYHVVGKGNEAESNDYDIFNDEKICRSHYHSTVTILFIPKYHLI